MRDMKLFLYQFERITYTDQTLPALYHIYLS